MRNVYRLKLLTFSTLFSLLFSGCNANVNLGDNSKTYNSTANSNDVKNDCKGNDNFNYVNYFNSLDVEYKQFDASLSNQEILNIVNQSNVNKECTFFFDENVIELKDKIKDNSQNFCLANTEYTSIFLEDSDNKKLKKIKDCCVTVFDAIIDKFIEEATNDLDEDICHMQTLSIVLGDTSSLSNEKDNNKFNFSSNIIEASYLDDKNVIIIDYQSCLDVYNEKSLSDVIDSLSFTLEHELNHCRARMCSCREDYNQFKSIDYNPPYVSFLSEAFAESSLYNYNNDYDIDYILSHVDYVYDYAYIEERKEESLLLLLALFNEDASINDYYNAIYDTDFKELYDFFQLKTEEDFIDFYNILFYIDASIGRNSVIFDYFGKNNIKINKAKKVIGCSHRNEIFNRTLSNLVKYTEEHNSFSFEENIVLFNFIKYTILDGAYYVKKGNNDDYISIFDKDFSNNFWNSNIKYIEFLCSHYEMEFDDVVAYDSEISQYGIFYDEQLERLAKRFPLIKSILIISDYYFSSDLNEEFIENNSFSYKRIKVK